MVPLDPPPAALALPPIVRIVLSKIVRLRVRGAMPESEFRQKITRLTREELAPRGLVLLVRELPGDRIRLLVKAASGGRVCNLFEYPREDEFDHANELLPSGNAEDQIPEPNFGDAYDAKC